MSLVAGRDLHIIACRRLPLPPQADLVLGVRWASRPDLGFPIEGYDVRQRGFGDVAVGRFFLPASRDWATFAADAQQRKPLRGPWFASIDEENLGYLLPVVRLADPQTPSAELPGLVPKVIGVFGALYTSDPALAWQFWPTGEPPPIDDLLADPAVAAELVKFYRRKCTDYLNVLALRFEYAVLLGLATDHLADDGRLYYEVEADWWEGSCIARSDPKHAAAPCDPAPPAWFTADRVPGTVGHPAFTNAGWTHPPELSPHDGEGNALPAAALVPRVPGAWSALAWARPAPEDTLIGYRPVLYRVGRFAHGRHTAAALVAPPLPAAAVFDPLTPGEDLLQGQTDPSFLDGPGIAWPPLEGHYHYAIRGVNLLGVVSANDTRTSVRHHDDLAPVRPRASAPDGPVLVLAPGESAHVRLRISWDAAEDFVSPDVTEFRFAATWTPQGASALLIHQVFPVGTLFFDLVIDSIAAAPDAFTGLRLSLDGAEYPVVSHGTGTNAPMRVRRVGAHVPTVDATGLVIFTGHETARSRILRVPRRPAVITTVAAAEGTILRLNAVAPAEPIRLYLHLLRGTVSAVPTPAGSWQVEAPADGDPMQEAWVRWRSTANPNDLITGSPAIIFPQHIIDVVAAPPTSFIAGILELSVTAADDAQYVSSPTIPSSDPALLHLTGNESARTTVVLSTRVLTPPAAVPVDAWAPHLRIWATSAATFAEGATYDVTWGVVAGAARYEVWRALDGDIAGAETATGDAARRQLAAEQPEAFGLRSNRVFAAPYTDRIPGRAPTRAYYRVRAVGLNGIAGTFSAVIGPVYVPDVRPPPAPNLLRAVASADVDRTIRVEWTQPGDPHGVEFLIEQRREGTATWSVVGTRAGPAATDGRHTFTHLGVPPSTPFEYRVRAVRKVKDPVDPTAVTERTIAGLPSATRVASALLRSPLSAPTAVAAAVDAVTGNVTLTWANGDAYESVAIRRRGADHFAYTTVATLPGSATAFTGHVPTGAWRYQIRGSVTRHYATTDDIEVTVQ